jgi:hypothetical protein
VPNEYLITEEDTLKREILRLSDLLKSSFEKG